MIGKMMDEIKALRKPLSERLPEDVFNKLHQVVGEAAMCWTDIEHVGRFKVDASSALAFELCHYVADLLDEAREELGDDDVGYVTGEGQLLKRPMLLLQILGKIKIGNRR